MFDFIQNLTEFLLNLQKAFVTKNLENTFSGSYSNKTSKKVFTNAASLELTSKTETNKTKLEANVKNIVSKYKNDPNKLIAFVRKNGTKVYKLHFAAKFLKLIGYEQGFISATNGLKALYLNVITSTFSKEKLNLSFKTEPMFILPTSHLDAYSVIQHFYKWYAMKLNLPGFETSAQNNFQKFMTSTCDEKIKELNFTEILELKEAIARDAEAIDFVIKLARSTEGSKKALGKISFSGASV